jgi:hypothetical protein
VPNAPRTVWPLRTAAARAASAASAGRPGPQLHPRQQVQLACVRQQVDVGLQAEPPRRGPRRGQRGSAGQVQLAPGRVQDRQLPRAVGVQLEAVVEDREAPRLRVVHARCPGRRLDDLADLGVGGLVVRGHGSSWRRGQRARLTCPPARARCPARQGPWSRLGRAGPEKRGPAALSLRRGPPVGWGPGRTPPEVGPFEGELHDRLPGARRSFRGPRLRHPQLRHQRRPQPHDQQDAPADQAPGDGGRVLVHRWPGAGTWLMVSNALGRRAHHRSARTPPGSRRAGDGPLTGVLPGRHHRAPRARGSGGKTYAELDREDPAGATGHERPASCGPACSRAS